MTVSLDQASNGYALLVDGFPSSGAASRFTARMWTGLTTLMLERGCAFSGSMDPQPVTYPEATGKITAGPARGFEGLADGDTPAVFPSDKKVGFLSAGRADLTITIPASQALESVLKGFRADAAEQLFHDERVRTAVDLYSAALFEQSPAARLLTFSMAFEVLAPITRKHEVVQTLISTWLPSVESAKSANAMDLAALAALESLERELLFRREASIRGHPRFCSERARGATHRQIRRPACRFGIRFKEHAAPRRPPGWGTLGQGD